MTRARPHRDRRRGVAMVAVALLLVVVQMVAMSVLDGASHDAAAAVLRVQSARARLNAESAAGVIAREWLNTPALPASATVTLPDGSATVVTPLAASPAAPGTGAVRGVSGVTQRDIHIEAP